MCTLYFLISCVPTYFCRVRETWLVCSLLYILIWSCSNDRFMYVVLSPTGVITVSFWDDHVDGLTVELVLLRLLEQMATKSEVILSTYRKKPSLAAGVTSCLMIRGTCPVKYSWRRQLSTSSILLSSLAQSSSNSPIGHTQSRGRPVSKVEMPR